MVQGGGFEPPKLSRQIYSLIPLATREPLRKSDAFSAHTPQLSTTSHSNVLKSGQKWHNLKIAMRGDFKIDLKFGLIENRRRICCATNQGLVSTGIETPTKSNLNKKLELARGVEPPTG